MLFVAPALEEPWGCGATIAVTQGNNGGLSHTGTEQFAWDFDLDVGHYVHSVADGTVARVREDSTVGGCDSDFGDAANYVVIDHGDGTGGLYLHLAPGTVPVQEGDVVRSGDFIGRVGLTGWVCGDHLHYQTQENCSSWYCQSVSAAFDDYGVPVDGTAMVSDNCVPCQALLAGAEIEIDEADFGCFTGAQPSWTTSTAGLGAHHLHAAAGPGALDVGVWRFGIATPGRYEIEAHIPSDDATASVSYRIVHDEGTSDVPVDQAQHGGWYSLGTFLFQSEADPRVELAAASDTAGLRVAYDGLRIRFVEGVGSGDSSSSNSGSDSDATTAGPADTEDPPDSDGSGSPPRPTTGSDDDTSGGGSGPSSASSTSAASDGAALPGFGGQQDDGCACTTNPPAPSVGWLCILLAGCVRRRR